MHAGRRWLLSLVRVHRGGQLGLLGDRARDARGWLQGKCSLDIRLFSLMHGGCYWQTKLCPAATTCCSMNPYLQQDAQ